MRAIIFFLVSVFIYSCTQKKEETTVIEIEDNNPALPGFDFENSDPEAVVIADHVMTAIGGRTAWDETRYISWTFFGRRRLIWDKFSGDVRIDYLDRDEKILVNIHSLTGQVQTNGELMTNPDSLASYLQKGKSLWINDSYWLVMPFKLKDSGVSLYYLGTDTTMVGEESHVLQMNFKNVGDTPENAYHVWVDVETNLVTQWAYYESSKQPTPDFVTPWADYQKQGNILLSGNRGKGQLTEIKVSVEVPKETFVSFEELNL